jgi:hypothetical protein
MATASIESIYIDYRTAPEFPPDYTLQFFEKNDIFLKNLAIKNNNALTLFIELAWQHLNALYQKDRYNETFDNALRYLRIIDGKINEHNNATKKNEWYYGILFFEGMAAYQLRAYKISTPVFKELTEHDSKSDNYKNWLRYSKHGQRLWISKTITVVCGLLLLIEIFFKKYIPSFFLRISLDGIALVGIMGVSIYEYQINRSFRKSNLK